MHSNRHAHSSTMVVRAIAAACLFGAGVSPAFAQYAQDDVHSDQAQWIVAPYLWALSVSTDLHTGRPPNGGLSTDRNFNSILDDLDGAFLVHAEVQKGSFGAFTDFAYLGLADHHDFRFFTTVERKGGRGKCLATSDHAVAVTPVSYTHLTLPTILRV